jgi:hypothetical protein
VPTLCATHSRSECASKTLMSLAATTLTGADMLLAPAPL